MKRGWLCMRETPIIPIPTLNDPLSNRSSGFLIPQPGYDNRFGLHYQQGYFWAINPSQDLTISPSVYSKLGYGSDFNYRYYLDRRSSGQWFASVLQQTELPSGSGADQTSTDQRRVRGLISGQHVQQVTDTLLVRGQVLRVRPAISPTTQQFRRPTCVAERGVEFLGTQRLRTAMPIFWSVSATVELRRPRYVSASSGSRVCLPQYVSVRIAVSPECGQQLRQFLSRSRGLR